MGTAFDVDAIIKKILDTLIKTLRDTLASLLMKAANVSCKWEALKDEPSLLELPAPVTICDICWRIYGLSCSIVTAAP